jgi:peptide/nickel transport system substrate-binding protein
MLNVFLKFFALVLLFAFSSCQTQSNGKFKKIFTYNETTGISSLDPIQAKNQANIWPIHQLYNTLVEFDETLKLSPSLAKSWTISSDGKCYTFILRADVFFQDDISFKNKRGRLLVASDVVYSLNRLIDPQLASPGAWVLNELVDEKMPFTAPNDSTFVLNLKSPYSPLFGILSMPYCSIVPKEAVVFYGADFGRHPVGSGPFKFISWHPNQAITLTKNESYFERDESNRKLPYLDGVQILLMPNKSSEFMAFQQHKIDFLNDIDPSFKDELITKSGNLRSAWKGKIVMKKHPYINTEYLGILNKNNDSSFLQDNNFRKAIYYAIDRKKMIFYLRNSIGTYANKGFVPEALNGFFPDAVQAEAYNPVRSKFYLEKSGYLSTSFPPEKITLTTVPNYAVLGTFICNELNKVGINAQVEVIQKGLLLEQMSLQNISFFRGSWIGDYPDPLNYFSVFYGKNPSPPNYTRFKNDLYDELFDRAVVSNNKTSRDSIFLALEQILINECPVIPLWYDQVLHFYQPRVKNLKPNVQNILELRRVDLK